jgi:hypothetical protein
MNPAGQVAGLLLLAMPLINSSAAIAWGKPAPPVNSKAEVKLQSPPLLTLSQEGKPATLALLYVETWLFRDEHNHPAAGRPITGPKLYWMLSGEANANAVFLPFDSDNPIEATLPADFARSGWMATAKFSYRSQSGAATGSMLTPVVCPDSVAAPSLRECAVPALMGAEIFYDDIYPKGAGGMNARERSMYFLFDGALRQSPSVDYYDVTRPVVITALSEAQGQAIVAAAKERQRKLDEQAVLAKAQAEEKQRLAAQAQWEHGRSLLKSAKRGATLFCSSTVPVDPGMQTSSVQYRCDLTGQAEWSVRELLAQNWDISNESRTLAEGTSGAASVSLILKKH